MKKLSYLVDLLMLLCIGFLTVQCQHEDENIITTVGPKVEHGTEIINCTGCTPLIGDANGTTTDFNAGKVPVGVWYLDKSHSNVMWETPYKVFGSLLTGRFNYFVLKDLNFDEGVPANISFRATSA